MAAILTDFYRLYTLSNLDLFLSPYRPPPDVLSSTPLSGDLVMSQKPVTPQYVEETMPPPSYEEVMGHQALSSVKANVPQEQLPPLAYIDIMPRCLNPGNMKSKVPPEYDRFR